MLRAFPSAVIENLQPLIDGGRYPIKRVTGEDLVVEADIFKEGHDVVAAALKWRMDGASRLCEIAEAVRTKVPAEVDQLVHSGELEVLMATYPDRTGATQWAPPPRVVVDRPEARTAAWYEFFPRSAEGSGERGSKLRDCLPRIEYAKTMGFNVIYFPPIHPIGTTNRKGQNNYVISQPDDPGVPYDIGNRHLGF